MGSDRLPAATPARRVNAPVLHNMYELRRMGHIVNDQHNVILMSNGQYRCDNCAETGEGYWAVSHQFPPRGEWSNTYQGDGNGNLSDPASDDLKTRMVNAMRANGYGVDDQDRLECANMLIRVLGWQREQATFAELPDYDTYAGGELRTLSARFGTMSDTLRTRIAAAIKAVDDMRVCKLSDADIKFIVDAVMRELDDACRQCWRRGDERDGCNCAYPKGHPSHE